MCPTAQESMSTLDGAKKRDIDDQWRILMLTGASNVSTSDSHAKLFSFPAQSAINALQYFQVKRLPRRQDQRDERVAWFSTHSSNITYIDCQRFATDILQTGSRKGKMHILDLAVTGRQEQHVPAQIENGTIVSHSLIDIRARGEVSRQRGYDFKFIWARVCHCLHLVRSEERRVGKECR